MQLSIDGGSKWLKEEQETKYLLKIFFKLFIILLGEKFHSNSMGGGDLNQKKSWHPHTLKNQEKVWKAEQAKCEEEKKVDDLRKEIQKERNREELTRLSRENGLLSTVNDSDKKLEWMYKNNNELINREEYLLGRAVDKSFETLLAEEKLQQQQNMVGLKQPLNHVEHDVIPFSIRSYKNLESTEQVDLQRKVMEDPLMLIKQRELESRRKILENPVKLKELHKMLKGDNNLQKVSKKSKKSKKAKRKKSKHADADSDSDLDNKLAKKLRNGLLGKDNDLTKLLDSKFETISKELDRAAEKSKLHMKKKKHKRDNRESESRRPSSKKRRSESRELIGNISARARNDNNRKISSTKSTREDHDSKKYSSQRNDRIKERSEKRNSRSRSDRRLTRSRSRSKEKSSQRASSHNRKSKLSEKEREAKLKEMMSNATWREEERSEKVQKHREAYEREERNHRTRDFDKEFLNKQLKKAMQNNPSVESRIKSNLNNVQRTWTKILPENKF
uniref:CBF1-interacting co-repressor CIR N-terminal domain-containing protein n=1 Tax=Glossina austeni TaxID=7395 RepID=A0A1A9UL26_GLOAU